jgi:uncharacterized protein
MNNKMLHQLAYVLLWAGGLNWGLIGLFNYNLVMSLLGAWPMLETLVYVLVGAAALYTLTTHKIYCVDCGNMKKGKK